MNNIDEAIREWNKTYQKKMTHNEEVMFRWGYVYALNDNKKHAHELMCSICGRFGRDCKCS